MNKFSQQVFYDFINAIINNKNEAEYSKYFQESYTVICLRRNNQGIQYTFIVYKNKNHHNEYGEAHILYPKIGFVTMSYFLNEEKYTKKSYFLLML